MVKASSLLSYINISNEDALIFCSENSLTPFPFLAIEIALYEKLKLFHILSLYKKKPFLLISLFPKDFAFNYIPYYGYVSHKNVRDWHINKSTHKQILIDENIKYILNFTENHKEFNFSISTEPGENDFRGIDWALTYNEHLKSKVLKGNLYTGILNLLPRLTLDDWIQKNFDSNKKRNYKKANSLRNDVEIINYLPDDLSNIYSSMFKAQEIIITDECLKRFIFIVVNYIRKKNGIGEFLFFKKLNQDEKIIGYDFFILFKKTSYYLFGINNPNLKKGSFPSFFWAQYRQSFIKKGIERIDFVGVNSPQRGKFKTSLGSQVIPYWYFFTEIIK